MYANQSKILFRVAGLARTNELTMSSKSLWWACKVRRRASWEVFIRLLSIVFGPAKYSFVTSGFNGEILKKGPRIVSFSIAGADVAIWNNGSCATASRIFGN